ncbi:MAG: cupin domain-containing protein [Pseudooceanicola sp.]|nr:cupin domain-containing protein [Pseudooceanicola sp.]
MRAQFDMALDAMHATFAAVPALREFSPLPAGSRFVERLPKAVPVVPQFERCTLTPVPEADALFRAARALAPHVQWYQGYTEEKAGRDFARNAGYFELLGVDGHFNAPGLSAFLLYLGPNLHYRRHWHEAEELYYIIAGEAYFQVDGEETPSLLRPGDSRFHASFQPHQTMTGPQGILCLVLWRGAGLNGPLEMETAPGA